MVNTSRAYREAVASGRRDWVEQVTITLADSTILNITNAQIWSNGLSIEDAVSGDNSFDALGATVINKATVVLNNIADEFSAYDFDNALVRVRVGLQLSQDTELLDKGYYTVAETKYDGSLITLECYDYMAKFDRPYSDSTLAFPATLAEIVRNACSTCGITLGTQTFPNSSMIIPTKPTADALTFREVLGWCAQMAGCFARISGEGRLELKWFNGDVVDQESGNALDGGVFDNGTPQYSTGDSADGGSFNPWNTGDEYDGGTFADQQNYHVISAVYNPNVATDDTVITGVKIEVKTSSESETALAEYTYGTEGYTIGISDNDFITEQNAQSIANFLGQRLVGLRFRKATVSHGSDPSIEAGDVALLRTAKGLYVMLITRTVFSSSAAQTTVCASETVARNSATRFTEATKNYVKLRDQIVAERSARELAVAELAEALAESSGLYNTTISAGQVDPSTGQVVTSGNIFFLHDRPLLAESKVVWKMTSDAFGVTNDYKGQQTVWTAGLTVDGNLIANILSAVGVNADWINTGALTIKDLDDNETFYANADTGEVRILALSDLAKAGTNIMRNTLVPTSEALPKIGATGITSGSDLHVLSSNHGIGTTTAGAGYAPYLYFDSTSTLLATGETYTFSFNYEAYLLYSATPATEDYNFVVRFYKGDTLVKEDVIETMHAGDSDCDLLGFYAFTFTVPSDVSGSQRRISITVSPNEGASLGADDFFELTNLMLIKGAVAAPWSAAPEDLDQTTVFNKLTNDGALQGLYMENGKLYVNASYIHSGTLKLGGANDTNGMLNVYDANGNRIGRWSNNGLWCYKGLERLVIQESVLYGGFNVDGTNVWDGTLDLSAQYDSDNTRKVVLDALTSDLCLQSRQAQIWAMANADITLSSKNGSVNLSSTSGNIYITRKIQGNTVRVPIVGSSLDTSVGVHAIYFASNSAGQWFINFAPYTGRTFTVAVSPISDRSVKKNIRKTKTCGLDIINKLNHVSFDLIEGGHSDCGYIAQELKEVCAGFVVETPSTETEEATLYVVDHEILAVATKAIQELDEQNKQLEERVSKLEKLVEKLIAR